jgi:hypothetical protein
VGGKLWITALLCQLRLWVEGWRLTVLPLGQKIRCLPSDIPAFAPAWLAVALHLALAALVVRALATGKNRVAAACVAWWYLAQAPTSNIIVTNLGYMFAPRSLFLAMVLPVAAIAAWLERRQARGVVLATVAAGDRSRVPARVQRALDEWTHTADVLFESGVLLSYCGQRECGRELLARAAERAGRDYYDMVGDFAWHDLALLRPLVPLTPPSLFASFSIPKVGP